MRAEGSGEQGRSRAEPRRSQGQAHDAGSLLASLGPSICYFSGLDGLQK